MEAFEPRTYDFVMLGERVRPPISDPIIGWKKIVKLPILN
jgi:hypothetical protein